MQFTTLKFYLCLIVLLLLSCKKEAAFNTEFLFDKFWYLESGTFEESGNNSPLNIEPCDKDNNIQFLPDNMLIWYLGGNKCNALEPDSIVQTWKLIEERSILEIDDDEFVIMEMTTNKLKLSQQLNAATGRLIIEKCYRTR